MDLTQTPKPEELAAELAGTLRTGITTKALMRCPAILALAVVRAKAASDDDSDRAVAAYGLLRELVVSVDGRSNGAVATLLGLAAGGRGALLKERRRQVADLLNISAAHLRTSEREAGLIEALADELYAADSAYRLRHRHRTEPERVPEQSRLGVNWLEQHRSYRRIWTPLSGMKNDLHVLRGYLAAETEDRPAISDRLCSMTWHWTRFLTAIERFVQEQGGLWLLADMDSEIAAADAIYKVKFYVPLGENDDSWLRTLLAETAHEELDGFGDKLIAAGEQRRELMSAWAGWASCPEPDDSECGCDLHAWLRAAEQFIRLIDEDWYRIADFYRTSGADISGLDVRGLWEGEGTTSTYAKPIRTHVGEGAAVRAGEGWGVGSAEVC
jgi:hypothetical protein